MRFLQISGLGHRFLVNGYGSQNFKVWQQKIQPVNSARECAIIINLKGTIMAKLEYTFKNDTLFKMLFVRYPGLLKRLVAELLGIKPESIGQFEIRNPEMPPESLGDKFCRLDINMTVNGQRVDLEIQVRDEGDFPERTLFHWAREYSTALGEGGKYHELPRVVIISSARTMN
jgi:hypothetical protein